MFHDIDYHVPLTTVGNEIAREMVDEPVIDGKVRVLNHELEIIIRLVQFVPEEQIGLFNMSAQVT